MDGSGDSERADELPAIANGGAAGPARLAELAAFPARLDPPVRAWLEDRRFRAGSGQVVLLPGTGIQRR